MFFFIKNQVIITSILNRSKYIKKELEYPDLNPPTSIIVKPHLIEWKKPLISVIIIIIT